jgi:hypothetical protein
MDYPLKSSDIKNIFNGKIKILLYSDIAKYNSIEELLHPYGRVIFLYYWKNEPTQYGHWCCCFYNGRGNIEYFNSFGGFIDETLKDIDYKFRKENNQDYKHLTALMLKHNGDIEYNDKQLQKKVGTATCGRWCCYRMQRMDLNIDEFQKIFNNIKTNDKKIISKVRV